MKYVLDIFRVDGRREMVKERLRPVVSSRVEHHDQKMLDIIDAGRVASELRKPFLDADGFDLLPQKVGFVEKENY